MCVCACACVRRVPRRWWGHGVGRETPMRARRDERANVEIERDGERAAAGTAKRQGTRQYTVGKRRRRRIPTTCLPLCTVHARIYYNNNNNI